MIKNGDRTDDFLQLEGIRESSRRSSLIILILLLLALLILFVLTFYPSNVISFMSWVFRAFPSQLLFTFSKGLLLIFSLLMGVLFLMYLWKYLSLKRIIEDFYQDFNDI